MYMKDLGEKIKILLDFLSPLGGYIIIIITIPQRNKKGFIKYTKIAYI